MGKFTTFLMALVGVVAMLLGASFVLALPVMWLWDWLIPTLFHGTTITWCQAWGLLVLCGFLFKSNK